MIAENRPIQLQIGAFEMNMMGQGIAMEADLQLDRTSSLLRVSVPPWFNFRAIDKWLPGYLAAVWRRPRVTTRPCHLMYCVADHFEPYRGGVPAAEAQKAVQRWVDEYPRLADDFRDADGRGPRHTFFYPQEEYDADCLDRLAGLCSAGHGEVEIHLHHRHDTAEGLRNKLVAFRDTLRTKHGLLGRDADGRVRFGFVHGNWALCNSRADGDWCGVNEELGILRSAGCYADFTFPSAPSPTQPRMVNALYRAVDRTGQPGGCEAGQEVSVYGGRGVGERDEGGNLKPEGRGAEERDEGGNLRPEGRGAEEKDEGGDQRSQVSGFRFHPLSLGLMLITGPLALDWNRRKGGVLPRLDNGAITAANPPTVERARLWARQQIHVRARPEWVFVKVYTHGCMAENADVLLGRDMRNFHQHLNEAFNDGREWALHYVTAREMYNIVRAAEDGKAGDPGAYRDYEIMAPSE